MQACTVLNVIASAVFVGFSSFAACGGSQPPASTPEPTPAEPIASSTTPSPDPNAAASTPALASSGSPNLAAAGPAAQASPVPDRTMDDIRAVVAGNRDGFRACYERSLKANPGIKGTFTLKFVVNPDGTVKSAESDMTKSEIRTRDLESCAVGVLKGLKFPKSKKGMESTVSYPFEFSPKGAPGKGSAP